MAEERLSIIIDAETKTALAGFGDFIKGLDNAEAATLSFDKSMQQLQGELKDLKKSLQSATDIGTIKKLNADIQQVTESIRKQSDATAILANSNAKLTNSTANALPALTNFGRVIQDAPFGIMGIANNIDPLVTSFQLLQKQTGSTTGALSAMLSSLAGPAGIGIAISAVTSALIAFGPEIGRAITGVNEFEKAQTDAALKGGEAFKEATFEFKKYADTINDGSLSLGRQKEAFDAVNKLIGEYGLQINSITQFQKVGAQVGAIYAEIKREEAKSNVLAAKAAEVYAKSIALQMKAAQGNIIGVASEFSLLDQLTLLIAAGNVAAFDTKYIQSYAKTLGKLGQEEKLYNTEVDNTNNKIKDLTKSILKIDGVSENYDAAAKAQAAKKAEAERLAAAKKAAADALKQQKEIQKQEEQFNQRNAALKYQATVIPFAEPKAPKPVIPVQPQTLGGTLDAKTQQLLKQLELQKQVEKQQAEIDAKAQEAITKQAAAYANLLFPAVDSVFSALQNGTSITDALGESFKKLAVDLAAAAVKAGILAGIMALINPAGAAGGGFGKIFGSLLGFANGGIINKPTIGVVGERNQSEAVMPLSRLSGMLNMAANIGASSMGASGEFVIRGNDLVLATNRANNSLNLRRG